MLRVYDENGNFRDLIKDNLDDDLIVGYVLLKKECLKEINKYYTILGYAIINHTDYSIWPIDIQENKVVIFEGTYNCMNEDLKQNLVQYNIQTKPEFLLSRFFIEWQYLISDKCFTENGSMIKLCSNILANNKLLKESIVNNIIICEPSCLEELQLFIENILKVCSIDINVLDYSNDFKYLIDSIRNGYYIRLNIEDIKVVFYNICSVCNFVIEGNANDE